MEKVRIGVFKCGNIGSAPLLELLFDELADREDIVVRTVTTGSKMDVESVGNTIEKIFEFNPHIIFFTSPNTSAPGPSKAREILSKKKVPTIVITDGPGKRVKDEIEKQGLGYTIIMGDPLIGARREFLDPTEMSIFNSNVIKVLSSIGVFRLMCQEFDKLISAVKSKANIVLPKLIIDTDNIRDSLDFKNPYARAKAIAAYEMLKKVAEINSRACFIEKEMEKYVPLVACAHEIAQAAADLAEQAREIEKYSDTVLRTPHTKEGKTKTKEKLMLPPIIDNKAQKKSR